jgi:hypothetical protein
MYLIHALVSLILFFPITPTSQPVISSREIQIDNKPLNAVIEKISSITGLNIIVKWNILEAAGVEKDTEITLHLHNISTEKLLELILEQAGDGVELSYIVDDGVIIISTTEDLSRKVVTKVYSIKDLLITIKNFRSRINLDNIGQGSSQGGIGGGRYLPGRGGSGSSSGGQSGGSMGGEDDENEDISDPIQPIIDLIIQTINPESWRQSGGNVGTLGTLNSQLIVTQTSAAHLQIRDL